MFEIGIALLPLLALLAALLAGCYPGHAAIVRLSERIAGRPAARAVSVALPRPPRSRTLRGGQLLAWGLAQRPPPLAPLPN